MNIDVREYLRINPISVHELTLSGDAKDCFLYFPANSDNTGYEVHTQRTMFQSLCKSIFQNIIIGNETDFRLNYDEITGTYDDPTINWGTVHMTDTQFRSWVRRHRCPGSSFQYIYEEFKEEFDNLVKNLYISALKKLFQLRTGAKHEYPGSVEIQTVNMKLSGWKLPDWTKYAESLWNNGEDEPDWDGIWGNWSETEQLYSNFGYGLGEIWCHDGSMATPDGMDYIEIDSQTLQHTHNDTKAETMTGDFTTNKGGHRLVGKFTIGNKELLSQDNYALTSMHHVLPIGDPDNSGELTYPLWGQNVINWRTRTRTHDNIPPSFNVHVRYFPNPREILLQRPGMMPDIEEIEEEWNAAEMQYESLKVTDMDDYLVENMSDHDYLLRMTLDGNQEGGVQLMKQTVQMLSDIFADITANSLQGEMIEDGETKFIKIWDMIKPLLDVELVPKSEFMMWYYEKLQTLNSISQIINQIKDALRAVKPLNYAGRVIISTKDDTEQKVIQHYGGKRWKRIMNFLKGVEHNSEEFGSKLGEEYVCLRESNIPVHTHGSVLETADTTSGRQWLVKNKGGQTTKVLNVANTEGDGESVKSTSQTELNYQLSPLEYEYRNDITMPHDNMPPYVEVYIWECMEATREEQMESGEPCV